MLPSLAAVSIAGLAVLGAVARALLTLSVFPESVPSVLVLGGMLLLL